MQSSAATNERNVILLAGIGRFGSHFFELMFPTLAVTLASDTGAPIERVLGWSFLGYLMFGLGAVPFGILAERIGARVLIISGIFGMGIFAIGAGESNHGTALAICFAGMGLFASIHYPVGTAFISRSFALPGRALAINAIFGNLAIALTPVAVAALCDHVGWRTTFGMVGYAACALAVACAFLRIDEIPGEQRALAATPRRTPAARSSNLFVLLLAAAALAGIAYRGSTLIHPAYFDERVSSLSFGATTSLVYLLGVGGQYFAGMLADRHDLRWLYFGFHAVSLPALIGMAAVAEVPLVVLASLFVFFSLGMQPIEDSLVAHVTPQRWRVTAFGLKYSLTLGVGSLAVWIVDWATAQRDLSFAILCLAGLLFLQIVVIAIFLSLSWGREFRNTDDAADTRSTLAPI